MTKSLQDLLLGYDHLPVMPGTLWDSPPRQVSSERNWPPHYLMLTNYFAPLFPIMLYALIFPPTSESWTAYVRRALRLLLNSA